MKSALLPLNSESSRDDKEDRELARQISFTVLSNIFFVLVYYFTVGLYEEVQHSTV